MFVVLVCFFLVAPLYLDKVFDDIPSRPHFSLTGLLIVERKFTACIVLSTDSIPEVSIFSQESNRMSDNESDNEFVRIFFCLSSLKKLDD